MQTDCRSITRTKKLKAGKLSFLYIELKGTDFNTIKKGKWITGSKSDFLNELIKDCIFYGLGDEESLRYIEMRFKQPITKSILWTRKAKLKNEESGRLWLSYFTREGFVLEHKKLIGLAEHLMDCSMNELFHESEKPYDLKDRDVKGIKSYELKNDIKILRLKRDIRENIKLVRDLMVDSPMIAEIKGHLDSGFKLRKKLIEEYGIDVDDHGNLIEEKNKLNSRIQPGNLPDRNDEPERIF